MAVFDYPYETDDDPSYVPPTFGGSSGQELGSDGEIPDLAQLLKSQARLAQILQEKAVNNLDVKELKDIATASSSLVNGVHRTGELHRAIETYRLFHAVVLEFLRQRSDALGEDLLAELKTVAGQMGARARVQSLLG